MQHPDFNWQYALASAAFWGQHQQQITPQLSSFWQFTDVPSITFPLQGTTVSLEHNSNQPVLLGNLEEKPTQQLEDGEQYIDVTPFLHISQKEAASKLGFAHSTLSKRWKEVSDRKWPYKRIQKIDKKIEGIYRNAKRDEKGGFVLSAQSMVQLQTLQRKRSEESRPVKIRMVYTKK